MDNIIEYKEKLKQVLQEDIFNELMDFWRTMEEKEYDYKIFISKKCYVLYRVFIPLFDFYSYDNCIKITDTAIPLYVSKMKNSTILVIDDVFIHGRATSKVENELGGKVKEIKYYTFAKNSKHEEPQDTSIERLREKNSENFLSYKEMLNKALLSIQEGSVKGYLKCSEYQWKRISDLIMKSLWTVNMPYASYLPVVVMNDPKRLSTTKLVKSSVTYNSHSQEELQQYFSYYIQANEKGVMNNALIHYCFIVSNNDFTKDCKIAPMVFFDCENTSIDKKFIFDSIKIIYEEKESGIRDYFLNGNRSDQGLISLLKFLIFSVGYIATKKCLLENGVKINEYQIDITNAIYSFGVEIEKYIAVLKADTRTDLLNRIEKCTIKSLPNESTKKSHNLEEREKLLEGLREAYVDMKSCSIEKGLPSISEVLARYFKFNNIYNEENFYKYRQSEKRYVTGLRFSEIKDFLEVKKFTVEEIIFGLMYQYNLGAATIDFRYDYDRKNSIIGINMYWRAGEQSYKCISQTYVLIVYFQNVYNNMFNKEISKFLYDMLLELSNSNYRLWNIPFSKKDLEKYCNSGDNVYNAFDIDRYCEREEFKYLGYIAKQMQQYILRGHLDEVRNNDKATFKRNLFEFMKKHTEQELLNNCEKVLWDERNLEAN